MTAAEDRREELEAVIRQRVRGIPPAVVDAIMAAADAYAVATAKTRKPKAPAGPPAPKKPPAVHCAPAGTGGPACLTRHERVRSSWAVIEDPAYATCGHCRKTAAWREAAGGAL